MSNTAHNAKPIPKVLQYLSSNLRGYRQQAGLSQMALAELSGVSRRMLAGIEAGDRNVSGGARQDRRRHGDFLYRSDPGAGGGSSIWSGLARQGARRRQRALFAASVPGGSGLSCGNGR